MEAALHITINRAGDPEKLSSMLKAAMAAADQPIRVTVPAGYRCVECYRDDGGHETSCSVGIVAGRTAEEHGTGTAGDE